MRYISKLCIILSLFFLQATQVRAAGTESLWAERKMNNSAFVFPFDLEKLASFAIYFIHILLLVMAIFAFISIIKGGVGILLSSGNYDSYQGSKHVFLTAFVSFIVSVVILLSLDLVFNYISELSSSLA